MIIGSLFSGIGGLERGLERALDAETIWQVEKEGYPLKILAKHWPEVKRYEDIRMVHRAWRLPDGSEHVTQPLAPVDLICGGFPCQDISTAGTGAGLAGSRSGLWFEYLRIIRALRPHWVVIENVAALRRRGLGAILWGLAQVGYDAEWSVLSASDVGAPHLRRRLFIIAWLPDANRRGLRQQQGRRRWSRGSRATLSGVNGGAQGVANTEGRRRRGLPVRAPPQGTCSADGGSGVVDAVRERLQRQRSQRELGEAEAEGEVSGTGGGHAQPRVGRGADGLPRWVYEGTDPEAWEQGISRTVEPRTMARRPARLRAIGNAVVPQKAYEVGLRVRRLMEALDGYV